MQGAGELVSPTLPASNGNVTVLIDVAGTFSSQFQCHWCEVACSSFHYQFAHGAAPCVEDVVKVLPQQFLCLWDTSGHHRVHLLKI